MIQFDQNLKDLLQAIAWVGAGLGSILAAVKLWSELRQGREQRARDLRWKQAAAGKSLNDEMLTDPQAWPALQMLDYDGLEFELPSKARVRITRADLRIALDPHNETTDDKHLFVRECFDSLFYYMAMLEHYARTSLIVPADVAFPLDYYLTLLADYRDLVDAYVRHYRLERTRMFLEAQSAWKSSG